MIENKELGLIVAKDEMEKRWIEIKTSCEREIPNLEKMLWFQRELLALAQSHLTNERGEST